MTGMNSLVSMLAKRVCACQDLRINCWLSS